MKSIFIILSILLLTVNSCKYKEKPTFIRVEKIIIQSVSNNSVTFKANAVFKNNNDIGGKLITDSINVYTKNTQIGKLRTKEFNIPAKDTFSIPLQGDFSIDKIVSTNKNDILNSVFNILASKKIPITFKGDLIFKKGPFKYTYHIEQTNDVKIKL